MTTRRPRIKYRDDAHRVLANVAVCPDSGCWVWQMALEKSGYGRVLLNSRRKVLAHRFAYETFVGPVPEGLQLDHLCRNRACVNPEHLEPVTSRTNVLRSPIALSSINARKTHCVHGHPFDEQNTILRHKVPGRVHRQCRACLDRARADHYRRFKASRAAA